MIERPILFKGEMVQAILRGEKTQTRRIVKPRKGGLHGLVFRDIVAGEATFLDPSGWASQRVRSPYGVLGNGLWVRETWAQRVVSGNLYTFYRADCEPDGDGAPWHPSIFMSRNNSRIDLFLTGLRVERVQEITDTDARAEGVADRDAYAALWDKINAAQPFGAWRANPFVWVVGFERM